MNVDKWWDHGKYEKQDEDTTPNHFEFPYERTPVKWVMGDEASE